MKSMLKTVFKRGINFGLSKQVEDEKKKKIYKQYQ